MRHRSFFASLVVATFATPLDATADLGPLEPLADLHRAVRESLGLPEPLIVRLLERGLPDAELSVVGRIAAHVDATPERITELRLGGRSWLDITLELGVGPEIFYVDFGRDPGPPYGKAWGYYRKTPRAQWRTIRLTDAEIVDLANVRLCADHYRLAPARVVELRRGRAYAELHRELAPGHGKGKAGKPAKAAKGKGRGKSKKPPGAPPARRGAAQPATAS